MGKAATAEKPDLQALTTPSEHHQYREGTSTRPQTITAAAWLNAASAAIDRAKMRPREFIDLKVWKVTKNADGIFECVVARKIKKARTYEINNTTAFKSYDHGDGTLLDALFRGESSLREDAAARLLAVWANTVSPTPEEARNAGKALTLISAIRRGVALEAGEDV